MKAIILAAGYATRLYPLTKDRPKALLPVAGKPIIDYILEQIRAIPAIDQVITVTNDKFFSHFSDWKDGLKDSRDVTVLNDGTTDENNRRGAIGDIAYVLQQSNFSEDTLVIAGDNLFTFSLADYYDFFLSKNSDCVCAKTVADLDALKQLAVAETDNLRKIVHFAEKPENPRSNLAVYAAYMYKAQTLPLFDEYLKQGNSKDAPGYFIEWLYTRKDVYVYTVNGECYDVGDKSTYAYVNEVFNA